MQTKTKIQQTKSPSGTDWKRIDAMRDEDIDYSDIPELGPDFFANAILWRPQKECNKRGAAANIPRPSREMTADMVKVKSPQRTKKTNRRKKI